jgi:branched-subunit amino acid aminotransferase/4-amino-4-deoxychorismate lyase
MHDVADGNDRKTWTSARGAADAGRDPRGAGTVSSASRAVRYGDGVFVTLGIRGGVLLDAAFQLKRLRDAAGRIGLLPPALFDDDDDAPWVLAALLEDLGAGASTDGTARLQWSAGPGARGFGRDEVRAEAILDLGPAPETRRPALVLLDERDAPLPALPRLKTCSALAQVLCERAARALGADSGIRTRDGLLLETGSANLFWLTDAGLHTPAADLPLYAGSVRERVIDCALGAGLPVEEGDYAPDVLRGVGALLLTNAARGVEVAGALDGRALPDPPEIALALIDTVAARRAAAGIVLRGDPAFRGGPELRGGPEPAGDPDAAA